MTKDRTSTQSRETKETLITLTINLDGSGKTDITTGFGMLDHMLTLLFFWSRMDCTLKCQGDLDIDAHHSTEDVGLVLGRAFREALGDKMGISRIGYGRVPMDEALAEVTLDLSGRPYLVWLGDDLLPPILGHEEKDIWREFYKSFAFSGCFNLHIHFLYGKNGHHLLESVAKGMGLALKQACLRQNNTLLSTKGGLD